MHLLGIKIVSIFIIIIAAFFAFLLFPTFSKSSNVHAAIGCTYTPNTVAVGGQITVTSVDSLAGEIRIAGAYWPQPATGSVLIANIAANATITSSPISGTSSGSSPLPITAGSYAVRGPFGILCTTTGGGTSLSVTSGGGGGTPACTYTPNTVAVGGQITVTSVNSLAGEIRTAGAFWPQPTTGSVLLGNLAANATSPPLTVSGTSSGSSPLPITAGSYAVRVGLYGVLCTTTGGGTSLNVTGGGGSSGTCALGSNTVAAGSNLGFGYNNFAAGQKIFIWDGGSRRFDLGTTATGPRLVSLLVPATVPPGSYGGFIENAGLPSSACGPVTVTAVGSGGDGGRVSTPTCNGFLDCIGIIGGTNRFSANNLIGEIFNNILPIILGIAGMISVVMIFISGFQFATSSGNPEAAASARGRLTYALIGFAIATFAFALTQIIDYMFLHNSGII